EGTRRLLPEIIVKNHDAATRDQRPGQDSIAVNVGCKMTAVDIGQIKPLAFKAKLRQRLGRHCPDLLDPTAELRNMGIEQLFHIPQEPRRAAGFPMLSAACERIDANQLATRKIVQKEDGRSALP